MTHPREHGKISELPSCRLSYILLFPEVQQEDLEIQHQHTHCNREKTTNGGLLLCQSEGSH